MYPARPRGDEPWACHGNPRKNPPGLEMAGKWNNQNCLKIECYKYEHTQSEGNFELVRQR
jgi:hypothetical protein